jgi:hypothetical protein
MKKLLFLLAIVTLFTACSWAGGGGSNNVSTIYNESSYLLSKKVTDFDPKFGYEVTVYEKDTVDSLKIIENKVFVPKKIFEKIPEPNDSINVIINYIKDVEYGRTRNDHPAFWDFRFNLCIGYEILKK